MIRRSYVIVLKVRDTNLQTDADLLKEFSGSGSQAAFATLVERHGPMVHAVAMRTLSHHHDAEDVTQATFLVLAREAEALSRKPSVAGWLHTVSRRLALDAHRSRESRQRREATAMNEPVNLTRDAISTGFRRELDAALDGLPERYRHPLVLFHLEGASLDEVAHRLDLQPSTLRTRLSRAREMLRNILVRRGVEVASVAVLSSFLTAEAKAAAFTPGLLSTVVSTATGSGSRMFDCPERINRCLPSARRIRSDAIAGNENNKVTTSRVEICLKNFTHAMFILVMVAIRHVVPKSCNLPRRVPAQT